MKMLRKTVVIFIFALTLAAATTAFAIDGEGTQESPFVIETVEDLMLVGDFPDCYFNLDTDLVIDDYFTPLCTYGEPFSAVFDGCGHTVTIKKYSYKETLGVFNTNKGTVKNLNVKFTGDEWISKECNVFGGIAGENYGTIDNCNFNGNIKFSTYNAGKYYFGSIAGKNYGTITNSKTINDIDDRFSNTSYNTGISVKIGGIAGYNSDDGIINLCAANTTITRSGDGKGTLYGYGIAEGGTISTCYALGSGLTYGISDGGQVSNCYAAVSGTSYGIAYSSSNFENSLYDSSISGSKSSETGIPKTTAAMKMKMTYLRENWDFDNTWGISKDINDGYPYLLWEYPDEESKPLTETDALEYDGKLIFDVNIDVNTLGKLVCIATYSESGELLKTFTVPNYNNKKEIIVALEDDKSASYAKIFAWENAEQIKPTAKNETVTIVR